MMADAENKRKCFRCGCSFAKDNVKLFRFPKPAIRNLVRCELWAKYIFPEREYSSTTFQAKLHSEHRMLCQKHFKDEDFTDVSKTKLLITAVPSDSVHELPIYVGEGLPGPSHRIALRDITNEQNTSAVVAELKPEQSQPVSLRHMTNVQMISTAHNEPLPNITKIGKEKILRAKCTKYMKKICQLRNRIKTLKSKTKV